MITSKRHTSTVGRIMCTARETSLLQPWRPPIVGAWILQRGHEHVHPLLQRFGQEKIETTNLETVPGVANQLQESSQQSVQDRVAHWVYKSGLKTAETIDT